jgi:lipid-A-disaccharide synthase
MGTRRLAGAGVDLLADADGLAVMGLFPVLARLPEFIRLGKWLAADIRVRTPKVVLTIDYPGFNMRMQKQLAPLRSQGTRLIHMVAPQVWAWRQRRAKKYAQTVDELWCFFDFEPKYFQRFGCDARFVGHPLVDLIGSPTADEEALLQPLGLQGNDRLLVIAPGSRQREIAGLLPVFSQAVDLAADRLTLPDGGRLKVAVAKVPDRDRDLYRRYTDYPLVEGGYQALCRCGHAGIIASGTATLEAALLGLPHVLAYRGDAITARIARQVIQTEHVGLPNIVHGSRLVPELLQDELTPGVLADRLVEIWNEPRHQQMQSLLGRTSDLLGGGGAMNRMADRLAALID